MKNEDVQTAAGMSLPVVVFVVFLILKLTGLIGWSWWWVTSPLWIVASLLLLTTSICIVVFILRHRKRMGNTNS